MRRILGTLKAVFFWSYARSSWQWDVLCVLILAFIFLTPRSWFETGELEHAPAHQNQLTTTLLLGPELVAGEADRGEIERRVRIITNRPDARVTAVRQKRDGAGQIVALEVDIR